MINLIKSAIAGMFLASVITACGTSNSVMTLEPVMQQPAISDEVEASGIHYKLIEIRGIGEVYTKKLNEHGFKYTDELLKAASKRNDREKLAAKTGISEKLILRWANHIDLMRIKGIGPKQSNWLEAVGVDSIPELAQRNAANLHERLEIANNIDPKKSFVNRMVSLETVQKWIDTAKKTDPSVIVNHAIK